jgi:hypothetical protein
VAGLLQALLYVGMEVAPALLLVLLLMLPCHD